MIHVISLINLAELANVVEPDTYRPGGMSAQDRKFFIHVRLRARTLLAWLSSRFSISVPTRGISFTMDEFAEEYLAYQMITMRTRKQFYDRTPNGTSHASSITVEELDREFNGCRQHFSTTFCDEVEDVPSLSLPSTHHYEVLVKPEDVISDMAVDITGETINDLEWKRTTT